jgi:hypothetical protein
VIDPNELAPLKASVEWRGNEGHFEEQCLAPEQPSRFPLRPVDVFRDLGMTEEIISTYLWRWRCAG